MAEGDNFFSRWSRRKVQERQGAVLPVPEPVPEAAAPEAQSPVVPQPLPAAAPPPVAEPPPTLDDVALLDRESDYSRFVARGVDAPVRNAALKKLFTDPHFNVMDGLDTYIEDFGQPNPLPPGMLAQMAQARFMGLLDDEDDPAAPDAPATAVPTPQTPCDENTDLRLQPHDDAGCAGPEPGPAADAAGQH